MSTLQKTLLCCVGAGLVVFLLVIVFRDNGLLDLADMKEQLEQSEINNETLKRENTELFNEVERLKNDINYLESVARKDLGMIKEDEIIIKFHSDSNNEK